MVKTSDSNLQALRGKVVEVFGTIGKFADAFGITQTQMQNKLNGKSGWSLEDVQKASVLLNIKDSPSECHRIFFDF